MLINIIQNNFVYKHLLNNRLILIIYVLLILILIIYTLKIQEKQIETFVSFNKFNNVKMRNKDCRKNCYVKYNENKENLKICKKYCGCNKKCHKQLNNKKCLKKCKEFKSRISTSEISVKKKELKKDLKTIVKKKKKQEKIDKLREERKNKKAHSFSGLPKERKGYFNYLINTYFSDKDKLYLFETNQNITHLFKNMKNIFEY